MEEDGGANVTKEDQEVLQEPVQEHHPEPAEGSHTVALETENQDHAHKAPSGDVDLPPSENDQAPAAEAASQIVQEQPSESAVTGTDTGLWETSEKAQDLTGIQEAVVAELEHAIQHENEIIKQTHSIEIQIEATQAAIAQSTTIVSQEREAELLSKLAEFDAVLKAREIEEQSLLGKLKELEAQVTKYKPFQSKYKKQATKIAELEAKITLQETRDIFGDDSNEKDLKIRELESKIRGLEEVILMGKEARESKDREISVLEKVRTKKFCYFK